VAGAKVLPRPGRPTPGGQDFVFCRCPDDPYPVDEIHHHPAAFGFFMKAEAITMAAWLVTASLCRQFRIGTATVAVIVVGNTLSQLATLNVNGYWINNGRPMTVSIQISR